MENPSRRRVLTAGFGGAVATALIGSRASATTPTEPPTTGGTDGTDGTDVPATTAAPTRPTEADEALLAFAQGAELAARDLYRLAVEAGAQGDGDEALAAAIANHQAAADALSATIGGAAPQRANADLVASLEGAFGTDDLTAVAAAGYELENTLVATHTELVGQLENLDGASRVAAILVAEAQMAAVLADLGGQGDDLAAMIDNSAAALTPPEA